MRFFSHSADKSKDATLLKELSQAKQEMEDAYANFQNVSDSDRLLYLQKPRCLETLPVSPSSGAGRITSPVVVS